MAMFYWNGDSVNGHVLLEWGFSQWPFSTEIGIQSIPMFYWNGDSVNGNVLLEWGFSQ